MVALPLGAGPRPLQAAPYAIERPHPSPAASPATVEEPRESICGSERRAAVARDCRARTWSGHSIIPAILYYSAKRATLTMVSWKNILAAQPLSAVAV
eukprot:scaffold66252_cov72-Phaeocystis_antarctica.AAC.1